jgi:Uncharacterized protein conserved in bacteria (DUF2145)
MRWRAVALLALISICNAAIAGRACTDARPTPESVRKGLLLAHKTFQVLDQTDARIALIGRVGSDLSRHNQRYSHMGMVVRDHAKLSFHVSRRWPAHATWRALVHIDVVGHWTYCVGDGEISSDPRVERRSALRRLSDAGTLDRLRQSESTRSTSWMSSWTCRR